MVTNPLAVQENGFNPWVGKIPKKGNGRPLKYSCLENPMERGAWLAIVHGVAKSLTWPKRLRISNPLPPPFSFCLQSFPASFAFNLFHWVDSASGGQSIGASASASVLPVNVQGWFPLGLTGLISLHSKAFVNST